jgi:large subunit ribosomal protein L10
MANPIKEEHISFVKGVMENSECVILSNVEGLNAAEVANLRRGLRAENVGFKVIKNKLARIAIADTSASSLHDDFVGSTAIAWSDDNPVSPAKILVKFAKELEKLQLKSGFNAKKRLDVEGVTALSKLPSLDELRAQLLGLFVSPASRLLAQIKAPASHVVGVMEARVQKEKE